MLLIQDDVPVPVKITAYSDRTFEYVSADSQVAALSPELRMCPVYTMQCITYLNVIIESPSLQARLFNGF